MHLSHSRLMVLPLRDDSLLSENVPINSALASRLCRPFHYPVGAEPQLIHGLFGQHFACSRSPFRRYGDFLWPFSLSAPVVGLFEPSPSRPPSHGSIPPTRPRVLRSRLLAARSPTSERIRSLFLPGFHISFWFHRPMGHILFSFTGKILYSCPS